MPRKPVEIPVSIINLPQTEEEKARWLLRCTDAAYKAIQIHLARTELEKEDKPKPSAI